MKRVLHISLTRRCNYNCSWCVQRYDLTKPMHDMSEAGRVIVEDRIRSGSEWINGLNEFPYKAGYKELIFSGGEPSLHPDFFDIVARVKGYKKILTTNLSFDVNKLIKACQENNSRIEVHPSFHFESADFDIFLNKIKLLDKYGMLYQLIPVSIVELPDRPEPHEFKKKFTQNGYRPYMIKFQGYYKGKFNFATIEGFGSLAKKHRVVCYSALNSVKPNGDINFCSTDEYDNNALTYGNICDKVYRPVDIKKVCYSYGKCHVCAAPWIKIESPDTKKILWRGQNFPEGFVFFAKSLVNLVIPKKYHRKLKDIYLKFKRN